MAFCRLGPVPHSQFLGWHDTDRAKALAYERWLARHCPGCGQMPEEWRDESGKELLDPPFEIVESVCPACAVLDEDREEREKAKGAKSRPGLKLGFRRVKEEEDPGEGLHPGQEG